MQLVLKFEIITNLLLGCGSDLPKCKNYNCNSRSHYIQQSEFFNDEYAVSVASNCFASDLRLETAFKQEAQWLNAVCVNLEATSGSLSIITLVKTCSVSVDEACFLLCKFT